MAPSQQQLFAISITERICSAISLIGTFIIVTTFIGSRSFRRPINRLVFYASWGNIMANIATLISQDSIHAGVGSSLCQFQAFLIQWFMPADALWTFAMACNVYLTFFHKYNSEQLRQLEWKYVIFCYGLPFIPAFAYFFIKTQGRGRIYGSAIIWCWVSLKWDYLRIAVFYGPVWLVIFLTFAIYLRAGSVIYQKRRQLRIAGAMDSFDSEHQLEAPLVKLSGIHVTSEIAYSTPERQSFVSGFGPPGPSFISTFSPYSVTIEAGPHDPDPVDIFQGSVPPLVSAGSSNLRPGPTPLQMEMRSSRVVVPERYSRRRSVVATAGTETRSAALAYTKYAVLFFVALLVTWVPSTANRVYALVLPDDFSFGLNFASSFVLPLQGFWNSLIYISISWPAFKALWRDFRRGSPTLQKMAR